jgi:hypothetical protein
MALVLDTGDGHHQWLVENDNLPQDCYFCGKPIGNSADGLPYCYWAGAKGYLFLHVNCALNLCVRLLRDVHEAGNKMEGEFVFRPYPPREP